MRKLLIIAGCAGLMACATHAGHGYGARVTMAANARVAVVMPQEIRGGVDAVYLAVATNGVFSAGTTGTVTIAYQPHHKLGEVAIVSNYLATGAAVLRPRVRPDTVAGVALAGSSAVETNTTAVTVNAVPYERITLAGEPVTVTVSSETNVVWHVVIVTE